MVSFAEMPEMPKDSHVPTSAPRMHVLYRITRGIVPLGAKLERFDRLSSSPFPCPNPRCNSTGFVIDRRFLRESMRFCFGFCREIQNCRHGRGRREPSIWSSSR